MNLFIFGPASAKIISMIFSIDASGFVKAANSITAIVSLLNTTGTNKRYLGDELHNPEEILK